MHFFQNKLIRSASVGVLSFLKDAVRRLLLSPVDREVGGSSVPT